MLTLAIINTSFTSKCNRISSAMSNGRVASHDLEGGSSFSLCPEVDSTSLELRKTPFKRSEVDNERDFRDKICLHRGPLSP